MRWLGLTALDLLHVLRVDQCGAGPGVFQHQEGRDQQASVHSKKPKTTREAMKMVRIETGVSSKTCGCLGKCAFAKAANWDNPFWFVFAEGRNVTLRRHTSSCRATYLYVR